MTTYNLVLFGVKETTSIVADYLYHQGIKVDLIVSINPLVLKHNHIADYMDLRACAQRIGAAYYCCSDYSLNDEVSLSFFKEHKFTTGIAYGWQRLIPESILSLFSVGIFGFHASPALLPYGKGRSPLNWSLILGKSLLYNHCFKYEAGADAGGIHSVIKFSITEHDTILTLLYKSLLSAKKQIKMLLRDIRSGKLLLKPQEGESFYFSKRSPEEGFIDFTKHNTHELINLIRALSHPFPGAYCYISLEQKIIIWEAWPFDALLDFSNYQPGEVIDTLYNMPVIKTIDGSIIIKNYEGVVLKEHNLLGSVKEKNDKK